MDDVDRKSVFLRLGPRTDPPSSQDQNKTPTTRERISLDVKDRCPIFVTDALLKSSNKDDATFTSPRRRNRRGRGRGKSKTTRSDTQQQENNNTNKPSVFDRLSFTNKHTEEIETLKAKLDALEKEKQDAKDLTELLMVNNYQLQNEKSKIQQEKSMLEREQNALLERLAYFHAVDDHGQVDDHNNNNGDGNDIGSGVDHTGDEYSTAHDDYNDGLFATGGELPITPDSGMLKAISAMRIQSTTRGNGDDGNNDGVNDSDDAKKESSALSPGSLPLEEFATKLKF